MRYGVRGQVQVRRPLDAAAVQVKGDDAGGDVAPHVDVGAQLAATLLRVRGEVRVVRVGVRDRARGMCAVCVRALPTGFS